MKLYSWAAQLCKAIYYFSNTDILSWVNIENNLLKLPLQLYLSAQIQTLSKNIQNPFLRNTILFWHQAHTFLNESLKLSCFSPIWGSNEFKPGTADMGFRFWSNKGLNKIKDLYSEGILLSFEQLTDK